MCVWIILRTSTRWSHCKIIRNQLLVLFGSALWTEFEFNTANFKPKLVRKLAEFFFQLRNFFEPPRLTSYRRGVQLTTEAMEGKTSLMFHTFYMNVDLILGLWALPIRCQHIFMRFFAIGKGSFWSFWEVGDFRSEIK